MDGLEEFEELFGLDMTDNCLSESFYSGPINFDNLFEETELGQFDSIVPDDISRFLDTQITEDISNFNVCNSSSMVSLGYDPLYLGIDQVKQEPQVPESCQVKQEVPDFFISHPDLNQVPAIDSQKASRFDNNNHVPINESINNSDTKKRMNQNEDFVVKHLKLQEKCPTVNHKTDKKKVEKNSKDVKSFHFCDLCPFQTKEKSIFRMHQSFVHKVEATKTVKKPPSHKSETIRRSYKPVPPKTKRLPVKELPQSHLTYEPKAKTRKSEVKPALGSLILPKLQTIQNGNQNNNTQPQPFKDHMFPVDVNKLSCRAFPTGTGQLRSILKSSEGESKVKTTEFPFNSSVNLFMPSGVFNGTGCKLILPAPNKPINILPKDPDYLLNRFQQTNPNLPEQINQRHLLNALERKRRSDNKGCLEAVKNMVPKLKFVKKPTQITILKETLDYVKSLQKTENDDSEMLEVQRNKFKKLNEKYNSFFSPYYFP